MGQTTNTLYVSDNPVLETDNSGKETGRTTYGAGIALSRKAGSETLSYLYNGHADVVALINSGGTAQATYTYDAFGVPLSSTGTAKNPIRYSGYEFDEETGYYYLKARFYDPKTARFLQEDTYRGNPTDPLSLNLYSYCSNNPVVYWDPTGHVRRSIDPSGAYHPDGSFTPIDQWRNGGSSGSGGNGGSTGTVSKETMDRYYESFKGLSNNASDSDRESWAGIAQEIFGISSGKWTKDTNNPTGHSRFKYVTASNGTGISPWLAAQIATNMHISRELEKLRQQVEDGGAFLIGAGDAFLQGNALDVLKFDNSDRVMNKPLYYQGRMVGSAVVVVKGGAEFLIGVVGDGVSVGASPFSGGATLTLTPGLTMVAVHGAASSGAGYYNIQEDWVKYSDAKAMGTGPSNSERVLKPNEGKHQGKAKGDVSADPFWKNQTAGQESLNKAFYSADTKQLYNIHDGKLIKFQPDNMGTWHAYYVKNTSKEVPKDVLEEMLNDGLITAPQYKKFVNNK